MTPRHKGRLRWRVALSLAVTLFAAPGSPVLPSAISATDEPKAKAVSEGMSVNRPSDPECGGRAVVVDARLDVQRLDADASKCCAIWIDLVGADGLADGDGIRAYQCCSDLAPASHGEPAGAG